MSEQIMLYMPVIHAGYERFLNSHPSADVLILGRSFELRFSVMRKEVRALKPERAAGYIQSVRPNTAVSVVEEYDLPDAINSTVLWMPDEELLKDIVKEYALKSITTVEFERTFLRWDRPWSQLGRPANFNGTVTIDQVAVHFTQLATEVSSMSSDWWRQVGAVAVQEGRILAAAHNKHYPSEYSPYIDGDPRNNFTRGMHIELTTALHAEAGLIAAAAKEGITIEGADLYVSTFPCPQCTRLIVAAGLRRCFFAGSYSVLDGETVLRSAGIEIYFVDLSSSRVSG